jgi:hypothetical protein
VSGAIAGAIVGGIFGLLYLLARSPRLPTSVVWGMAFGLSLFAWLAVLIIVGVFGNYGIVNVAPRALVTCILAGVITVWVIYAAHAGGYGTLFGWIIGYLIGRFLCRACADMQRRAG